MSHFGHIVQTEIETYVQLNENFRCLHNGSDRARNGDTVVEVPFTLSSAVHIVDIQCSSDTMVLI